MIWETPRLYLRELTEADLPQLMEMMNGQLGSSPVLDRSCMIW